MPIAADIYYHLYEGSDEGQRPPVVLLHGSGGTHLSWPWEVRRLPGYRVLALDLPGHGKSGGRGRQSIRAYASSVLNWLEETGIHSAVFIGHSLGSAIVLSLALDHPEHVLGSGVIGGGARLRVAEDLIEATASQTTFYGAVEKLTLESFSSSAPPRLVELALKRMAETRPSVLNGDLTACQAFDETDRICQINRPTLIMCGLDDRMTPVRFSQFLADQIKGSLLKIIPNAGHMVMLEQAPVVAANLCDFLASISY